VVPQVVRRVVGRGQHLDAEPLVERAGTELRGRDPLGDRVVERVGGLGRRREVEAEDVGEPGLEPQLHRGPAVRGPVRAQEAERRARRLGVEPALPDAEVGERDPLRVQHPGHVVVRGDEQRRRVGERDVVREPLRRHVAVRGDDRQLPHGLVQLSCDRADRGVRRQEAVGVQGEVRHDLIVGTPFGARQSVVGCCRGSVRREVAARAHHVPGRPSRAPPAASPPARTLPRAACTAVCTAWATGTRAPPATRGNRLLGRSLR
jgi:hypothetical protein